MTIRYPTDLDNLISIPKVTDLVSPVRATDHNILVDAALAIEQELGTNPSGVYATVKDRLDAIQSGNFSEYLLEKGDLITSTGSAPYRFEVGPDGYVLVADSTQAGGLSWQLLEDENSGGTVTGTGVANRVAFWTATSAITSSGSLTFDGSNLIMTGEVRPASGIRFNDGSLQTSALILGANTALSNLTTTAINTALLPGANDGYDLGSTALRWSDGYFSQISVNNKTILNDSNSPSGYLQVKGFSVDYLVYADPSNERVGLRTSNPLTTLHVEGDGYFNGYLKMANSIALASAAGEGALKWTGHSLELSDGYAWRKTFRKIGASVRDLWVDIVAGSDANSGTQSFPLRTIQEAVLRFKQPEVGPVVWDHGDDRFIHVVYTEGMPNITEMIIVPPHSGSGYLIIDADEQVLHSGLTQVGAVASIAGFSVRNRITIAETIPTGIYGDNSFLRPTNLITNTPLEDTWENLPVVANSTNTIDVTAYSPGGWSAFRYVPGATIDIVRPRIVWTWPYVSPSEYYTHQPMIVNQGSPLIVSGFIFETGRNEVGAGGVTVPGFLANSATGVSLNDIAGGTFTATRCIFRPGFSDHNTHNSVGSIGLGDGLCLNGVLLRLETCYGLLDGVGQLALNLRLHDGYGDLWPAISDFTSGSYYIDMTGSSAALIIEGSTATVVADIRSGRLIVRNGAVATFTGTIEGAGIYPAIELGAQADSLIFPEFTYGKAQMRILSASGSAGNADVGIRVGDRCIAILNGTATLSGTLGQVVVGDISPLNWSESEIIDVVRGAHYINL